MAVAHDFHTESHTGTTGHSGSASFSFSHNPVGTPRGVLVFVYTVSATKTVTSVTYGGTALTEMTSMAVVDTATEPGRIDVFFLGSGVPATDPATVVVNRTNNAVVMAADCITVTAAANTEIYSGGFLKQQEDGAIAEQSIGDGSTGVNSMRYAAAYTGAASPPTAGANSTLLGSIDLGNFGFASARETTAGQNNRSVGLVAASDDRAYILFAIREVPPTATFDQDAYRFRNDDGGETAATWRQAVNTPDSVQLDTGFRLRFVLEETAGGNPPNQLYRLQYRRQPSGGSFGGWVDVGFPGAADDSPAIRANASPHLVDGFATTQQISTGTFVAGLYEEGAGVTTADFVPGPWKTELEWSLIAPTDNTPFIWGDGPASVGDTIEFRLTIAGTPIASYTNTPVLTIAASGGGGPQDITLTAGIATSEAFGTAKLDPAIGPAGAIATGEAHGAPQLNLSIGPVGAIASAVAFGAATLVAGAVAISGAGGIASAEAHGSPTLSVPPPAQTISAAGAIGTAEAHGSPQLNLSIGPAGAIASGEAHGAPTLVVTIGPAGGIPSAEAHGSTKLTTSIGPAGAIPTAEAHGSPQLNLAIAASGIASAEAHGAPTLVVTIGPAGAIATAEAFGTPTLSGTAPGSSISSAGGIATAEAHGTPTLQPGGVAISGAGAIATAEAHGTPTLQFGGVSVTNVGGIASAEAHGTAKLNLAIGPAGAIPSSEAHGTPTLALSVGPAGGIATAQAFGTAKLNLAIGPAGGIVSLEAFGNSKVNLAIGPAGGIATAQAFGTPSLSLSGGAAQSISGAGGIASAQAFGVSLYPRTGLYPKPTVPPSNIGLRPASLLSIYRGTYRSIKPTGIASANVLGTPVLQVTGGPWTIGNAGGIASAEEVSGKLYPEAGLRPRVGLRPGGLTLRLTGAPTGITPVGIPTGESWSTGLYPHAGLRPIGGGESGILLGHNYSHFATSGNPWDLTGGILAYASTSVERAIVTNQLVAMKGAGIRSLRLLVWHLTDVGPNAWGPVSSAGGQLPAQAASNLAWYCGEVKRLGFDRLTIGFGPGWDLWPFNNLAGGPYDETRALQENYDFIRAVRAVVKEYGPGDTRMDLLNEAGWTGGEGGVVPGQVERYVKSIWTRYVAEFGTHDATFSIHTSAPSTLARVNNLLDAILPIEPPRFLHIHPSYNASEFASELSGLATSLAARGLANLPIHLGEAPYNDAQHAALIAAEQNVNIVEITPWPKAEGGEEPFSVFPPYTVSNYSIVPAYSNVAGLRPQGPGSRISVILYQVPTDPSEAAGILYKMVDFGTAASDAGFTTLPSEHSFTQLPDVIEMTDPLRVVELTAMPGEVELVG